MNDNAKSELAARQPNYFEQTEDRIHHAAERIASSLSQVRNFVDNLDGTEPSDGCDASKSEEPTTVFAKLGIALLRLEGNISVLEHEVERLKRLLK